MCSRAAARADPLRASPRPSCPPPPQGFSEANKLGAGGYGPVYRGVLDGVPVAVKCLDASEGAMQARASAGCLLPAGDWFLQLEADRNLSLRFTHTHVCV